MTTLSRVRSAVRGPGRQDPSPERRFRPNERQLRYGASFVLAGLAIAGLVASLLPGSKRQLVVLVATAPVPAGARLDPRSIAIEQVPEPSWNLAKSLVPSAGRISRYRASVPIGAGQIITAAVVELRPLPPPMREMTIPVPAGTIDPTLVQPGCRVDVVATFSQALPATSATLGTHLLVASFEPGQTSDMVTVDVPTLEMAVAMAQAIQVAKISLVGATGVTHDSASAAYPPVIPVGPVG